MRRFAFVLVLVPLVASAAPPTVIYRHPADQRPAFVAGTLSGPSPLAPEAAARAFVAGAPDLAPVAPELLAAARVQRLRGLAIVRFDLAHAGLPIVDAQLAVRLDASGSVRALSGRPLSVEGAGSPAPALTAADARALLMATYAPARAAAVAGVAPRLVWQPGPTGHLRLAWELTLPLNHLVPEMMLYRIDARTGQLILGRNLVRFADPQANIYTIDPDLSALTQVALPDLAPPAGDLNQDELESAIIKIANCVDNHSTTPVNYGGYNVNVHVCDVVPTVTKDPNGDYLQYQPVLDAYQPTAAPAAEDAAYCATHPGCDPFAEANLYWHIRHAYQYFQAFQDPHFTQEPVAPLQAICNMRLPLDMNTGALDLANITSPTGILYGWDNSFFTPPGEGSIPGLEAASGVVLFQGTHTDISYDATVVCHEFTHSVVWSTSNLTGPRQDEQGLDDAPSALNEGFADTFSSFINGQHLIANYSLGWMAGGARDLQDHQVCPSYLWGEPHQDSAGISESNWAIRQSLGAPAEKAIFAALASLTTDSDVAETVVAIEAALLDEIGQSAKDTADAIFVDHGIVNCQRVIPYTAPRELVMAEGTSSSGGVTPAPGYLQFKYTLAAPATNLRMQFTYDSATGSLFGAPSAAFSVYVRKDQPITWTYDSLTGDATGTNDFTFDMPAITDGATVTGSDPRVLEAGDYYLMIVGTGSDGGSLYQVTIASDPWVQDDASIQDDAAPAQDDAASPATHSSGCGCRSAAAAPLGLTVLPLLTLLALRRRRRG